MTEKKTILLHPGDPSAANALKPALEHLSSEFDVIPHNAYNSEPLNLLLTGTSIDNQLREEQHNISKALNENTPRVHFHPTWGSDLDKVTGYIGPRDKMAVVDEIASRKALEWGSKNSLPVNGSWLVTTGNPSYDSVAGFAESWSSEDTNRVRKGLGVDIDKYVIMFASQSIKLDREILSNTPWGYNEEDVLEDLLTGIKENGLTDEVVIAMRFHPRNVSYDEVDADGKKTGKKISGNAAYLKDMASSLGVEYVVDNTPFANVNDVYMASDVIVGSESTMLIPAAMLGRPVISSQPGVTIAERLPTNDIGVTISIKERGIIGTRLASLMDVPEAVMEFYAPNAHSFRTDGKSGERLADLIRDTAK